MKTAAEFISKKALFYANIGTHFAIVLCYIEGDFFQKRMHACLQRLQQPTLYGSVCLCLVQTYRFLIICLPSVSL